MQIKIITDSTSNLTPDLAKRYDIDIIPANVVIDEDEILDDGTIDPHQYYDAIDESKRSFTSVPSKKIIWEVIERNKNYDYLLIVNVSEKLSGFYSASATTARQYKKQNPDGPEIIIYDSKGVSLVLGTIAIKASQLVKEGLSITELIEKLDEFRDNDVHVLLTVSDLKKLYEGGRISRLRYLLADLIHAYPIFSLVNGELGLIDKEVGFERTIKKITSLLRNFYEADEEIFVWRANTKPRENQRIFNKIIEEIKIPKIKKIEEFYVGFIITCHTGIDVYGVITVRNFDLN
ncbi:MAG: DegV family protein [Candidatus Thorarchaeota archaeon]